MKIKSRKVKIRKAAAVLLLVAGAVSMVFGYLILAGNHGPEITFDPPNAVARVVNEPGEEKPSPNARYEVPPDLPRRLIIPSIGVNGFIQQVGRQGEDVGVPDSIFTAGWYTGSSKPGEPGVSILDGHVSGRYHDGIFKHLGKLAPGNRVTVEYGDYSLREFEVVKVAEYGEKQASARLFEQKPGIKSQLSLITCSGPFNRSTEKYQNRTIVAAKLLD